MMGTAKSRLRSVTPVTNDGGSQRDGGECGARVSKVPERCVSVRRRVQPWSKSSSDGRHSELSAGEEEEDLSVQVDRILADCDTALNTFLKMPKNPGLYSTKRLETITIFVGRQLEKIEVNAGNEPSSKVQEKDRPPQDASSSANRESLATAPGNGKAGDPSPSFPILYDTLEEELMNTIERDFG